MRERDVTVLRFGAYEANLATRRLRKHGRRIKLHGQPFQILAMLLERPGELVTREQMRDRLWPANTFVDFEHSLNSAVKKLRGALNDSAEEPRFIETVPRGGYRFIGTIDGEPPPAEAVATRRGAVRALPQAARTSRVRSVAVALSLLLVMSAATYFMWRHFRARGGPPTGRIMLAVLPFENLTGDPNQEYFSDGLTEEMITQLGRMQPERLGVIARTSVMPYKHGDRRVDVIGRDLGVQYVLEGTLRQASGRVRVTAQLIQVKNQAHLWAEEYDRDLGDVLALQEDVARAIAAEIQIKFSSSQRARLANPRPVDPVAHEFYLKGRYFWNKRTAENLKKAVEYFQQAIEKDPQYAQAYAGLADSYVLLGGYELIPPAEALPKAKAAAQKALEIDDTLAEAHASLGLIAPFFNWDWPEAERQFRRAIELNPNYATAHHWYGDGYLMPMGRIDEALAEVRRARELDPLSPIIITDVGKELCFARRYDEAIAELRKALELDPNFMPAENWLVRVYIHKGMYPEALAIVEKRKPAMEASDYLFSLADIYARSGRRGEARRLLAQLLKLAEREYVSPGKITTLYLSLGERDQAFAWLEKAYAAKSAYLTSLKVWNLYDPVRSDPRFADLVRRVGLPP